MRLLLPLLAVVCLTLAGCSGGSPKAEPAGNDDVLDVTDDTGGIRGVVVDQAIKPVSGAFVSLTIGKNMTTGDDGQFTFTGLAAGDYFIGVFKPGYKAAQVSANVVAGDAEPPVVKVLLEAISTEQPYLDYFKLDGFYECTFALVFITDGCDFAYRTAWDGVNGTAGVPPGTAPRTIQKFSNTQYITVPSDTFGIIQEGFWSDDNVPTFWIMIDETPIDLTGCDCSDPYGNAIGAYPLLNRLDRFAPDGTENTEFRDDCACHAQVGEWPKDVVVASRGFIPFQPGVTDVAYALNMQFTVITSLFHNYAAPEGWTFETRDSFPIG